MNMFEDYIFDMDTFIQNLLWEQGNNLMLITNGRLGFEVKENLIIKTIKTKGYGFHIINETRSLKLFEFVFNVSDPTVICLFWNFDSEDTNLFPKGKLTIPKGRSEILNNLKTVLNSADLKNQIYEFI